MHGRFWMNTWSKEINLDDYAECKEFRIHYYTRRMNGGYNSHLFLVNWDSEEQLLKGWNQIDSFVAVNIQSQTELLIERSNFYIIHFVKKTVMKEIKREIEYNPFCAKKYVYDNFQEDLYVERNYVEEKIFHLAVSEVTEYENKKMRVKKIKLKNFRGYKGCVEFNLVDQDKKPASFVVIYAPNGVGKTSLFDGVEYALKGEVSYLKNTEKISKFKGPIYHNREKAYEEAYASIFLDNGEEIHRKVHTLKENGTDTDVVAASGKKAKDIVGLKKDNNKWDNILLPHAKIDSFISASKPEERYIEWFNSTPELNEERKYFERIGKDISVIDKSLIEIKKEIARLENERKKLEKSESNFKNIQKLISAFNKRSETILPNITSLSTETEYDELLNEVKKIIRDYNRKLNIIKDHKILYNELNTMGFKEYKKRLNTIKSLKERISKISSLIENKKKLEKLEREYTNTKENHLKVMETLYPYNSILEVGKENIINLARKYKNAEEEIKKLNNMHFSVQKEIEKLNEEKQLREKNISKFKAILETEELGVNKFNELQETRSSIQIGKETFDVKKEYIKDINEKIFKLEKRLDLLEKKNVPFTIDEWTVSKISEWRELLKPIIIEQIDSLRMDYRLLENSILAEKESISKMKRTFLLIKEDGAKYQKIHKENCECPLCHSKFESWEALWKKIEESELVGNDNEAIERLVKSQNVIVSRYNVIREEILKFLQTEIEKGRNEIEALMNNRMGGEESYENNRKHLKTLEDKEKHLVKWFQINKIEIYDTQQEIFNFYALVKEKKLNEEKITQVVSAQIKKYLTTEQNIQVMLNDYKHQKSEIVSDTSKFPLVSFALNINMQFDENYEVLIRKNTDINNKLSHLKNELEPLTEFKVLNINVLENELENITQTVAKMELTVSDFTIYKNYTENEFLEMGDKYNAEKVELGIRIELLCQISEENTARFYFTNYKQNKRAMWNAERRSEKLQIEKENKIVELDKIQKNLEKELSLYFSKSTMNEIYQKIDPHDVMKRLEYHLSFNDAQKGELFITLSESESDSDSDYRPEIYFSTAQLNTVAFSSFFSRALDRKNNLPIQTIFIDDPIGHFDDMNILGFADLMRSLIDNSNWQIVISTHDEKIFRILQRKLSGEYYSSCFLKLPSGKGIKWIE